MKKRCLPLPVLRVMGASRRYETAKLLSGEQVPSTTQLLHGTLEEVLKITTEYAIDPMSRAWAIFGTAAHHALDVQSTDNTLGDSDLRGLISSLGVSGLPDIIEHEFGETVLTDYKTTSAFQVKRWMGGDHRDQTLQLNHYKYVIEEQGFTIDRMQLVVFVRDWSKRLKEPKTPVMVIPIPLMPREDVKGFFSAKKAALIAGLAGAELERCTEEERWGTRKCEGYCEVRHACPYRKMLQVKEEGLQ